MVFLRPRGHAVTPDDLLALLDLDGPDGSKDNAAGTVLDAPPASPALCSTTALVLDAWGLRLGRELLADSDRLRRLGLGEYAAADFLAAAFLPDPELAPDCADPPRREFLAGLFDTPAYRALHAGTALCEPAAAVAATAFAEEYARFRAERETADRDEVARGEPAGGTCRETAALAAAARAAAAAGRELDDLREASVSLGLGPGRPGANDPRAVAALFKRVRADPGLRRVCELAGRFRLVARSQQRRKSDDGFDEVTGVTLGGDVGRLVPAELARLLVPELELDALRRIAERQALCREYGATEPVGKGPVVVCVDESGSMEGAKAETAKALALAVAWVARRQRRWAGLVAYSGDSGERLLALPPGRWDELALADWVSAFIGRGSSLDVPVRELPDYVRRLGAPTGVTDVLFVTDAACRIPADVVARFNAWRAAARARVVSLVVGRQPGDLTLVSDECHLVAELSPDAAAVGHVLSF